MGQEDPLEKEMVTHSSILAWEIPWTESGGLQSMGSQRVSDMTEVTKQQLTYIKASIISSPFLQCPSLDFYLLVRETP